jgi:Tol biopolymer transport system component
MGADGSHQRRLTDAPNFNGDPNFSPNGKKITFDTSRSANLNFEVFVMRADGNHERNLTNRTSSGESNPSFSPNGKKIAFESDRDGDKEIYTMRSNGTRRRQRTHNAAGDFEPDWGVRP